MTEEEILEKNKQAEIEWYDRCIGKQFWKPLREDFIRHCLTQIDDICALRDKCKHLYIICLLNSALIIALIILILTR